MHRAEPARRLALLLAAAAAAPAFAIPSTPPRAATGPVPPAELRATLKQALELGQSGDCAGLLGKLDPLVPRVPAGPERNAVQLLRMNCMPSTGRGAEIAGVHRELAAADPDNPVVRGFGVVVAANANDMVSAGEQLATLAERSPAGLSGLSGRLWRGIAQRLSEQRNTALQDRLYIALARADWQPLDEPELRDGLAQGAIDALLRRRETAEAELLLPRIEVPETLAGMAIERVYAPLWPQIEMRMGPASGAAVDRFAEDRLAAFTSTPDDVATRREAVHALLLLGRYPEASATAAPIRIADGMDEDAVAAVRLDAQSLAAAGRKDAALDRLRPFAALDPAKTPVAVSGVLGLAEALDGAGRADEALAVARAGLAKGETALSPYGASWLRRTEVCALAALGRTAEAASAVETLRARAKDNEAAAIEASLCAGQEDAAARLAVATLGTPEGASRIADQFQPDHALWAPTGSRFRALWVGFLKRPDVKAAFDKAARILPQPLWPSRDPRPIPRAPSDGGPTT